MLNGTASGSRLFKQQDTQHGFFSTSTFSLKAVWIYLNQNIISNICLNIVEPIGYQRHTMSINPFKERLNSWQRLCVHFSRRHTLCTVVNLALPHFSHHTKQMNDLSHTVRAVADKNIVPWSYLLPLCYNFILAASGSLAPHYHSFSYQFLFFMLFINAFHLAAVTFCNG